ncbi:hypothetical protein MBLNU459_g7468t2 [Dothideomycetes sp. NU459]
MPRLRKRASPPVEAPVEEQSIEGALHSLRFNEPLTWRAGKPIAVAELLRRLKTLHEELRGLEQEEADRESLVPVAQELAHRNLIEHRDRGVKAWTALCIVEMFKLLAPDAPFKGGQLKDIFSLIITSLLPALGNPSDPYNEQHLQVIASLDEVKSIVLLTDIPGSDALLYKLFLTSFDIFADASKNDSGEELSKNVEHHITSLLITVVDESAALPSDVVDIILAQFLRVDPSTFPLQFKKNARSDEQRGAYRPQQLPPAYNMAKNLCNSCPDKMARMVSQYFNSIIVDASEGIDTHKARKVSGRGRASHDGDDDDDDGAPSGPTEEELKSLEKTHRLLRELWRSAALVIQNIIPQIEAELTAENIEVRLLATEAVGDLISGIGAAGPPPPVTLDPAAYPSQSVDSAPARSRPYDFLTTPAAPHAFSSVHPSAYQNFMNRRNDKSPQIRSVWVTCAGRILSTSAGGVGLDPDEESGLLKNLADMLLDTDEKTIGSNGGVTEQGSVLCNLADRIKDRKHHVRAEAMTLLGRIWGVAAGAITEGNERVRFLLGAIPSRIFEAIYINDVEINALVQQVLTDSLLPLTFPPVKTRNTNGDSQRVKDSQSADSQGDRTPNADAIRAERILILVRDLEQKAKTVFFALQARQPKTAQFLEAYLKQCESYNGTVKGKNNKEASGKLSKLIDYLVRQQPEPLTASGHLWKFAQKNDRRCYALIRFAMSPDSDYKKVNNAIKELVKRVEEGPGHTLPFLVTLLPMVHQASVLVYNKSHVPTIVELSRTEGKDLSSTAHEVLKEISTHNPEVFKAHVRALCTSLEEQAPSGDSPSDHGVVETLKACAGFAQRFPSEIPHEREFLKSMVEFALHGNPPAAAKHAVSVVVAADEKKDMYVKDIVTKCVTDFSYGQDGYLSRLAALSQLMLLSAKDIEDEHDSILEIAIQEVLLQVRTEASEDDPAWQEEIDDECAAKIYALKILANRLRSYATSSSGAEMETTVTETARPVFKLLTALVRDDGEMSKNQRTPAHHRSRLRLTGAILILKLCGADKRFDALLAPKDFNQLVLIVQDGLPEVRAAFVAALKKHLGQSTLPLRFYTLVFLFAFEPIESTKEATVTWLKGRSSAFAKSGDTIMEASFARFISLLAHHPDFSMDVENLKDFLNYIMFYLKTVATSENIPLIYYVAQRIKSVQDGIDPAMSDNLYCLSDIAQAAIRRYQEVQGWNLSVWPGKLRLPSGLFAPLSSHAIAQEISEKQYAPEELLDQIDDLVTASMRSKKRKVENSGGNQAKKRVRTNETKPAKSLPVRKPAKAVKTPKKKRTKETAAVPSSEIRRSTRTSGARNYAESDDSEEDDGELEVIEDDDDDDDDDDVDGEQGEEQEQEEEREERHTRATNGRSTRGAAKNAAMTPSKKQPKRGKSSVIELPDEGSDEELSDPPTDMED